MSISLEFDSKVIFKPPYCGRWWDEWIIVQVKRNERGHVAEFQGERWDAVAADVQVFKSEIGDLCNE